MRRLLYAMLLAGFVSEGHAACPGKNILDQLKANDPAALATLEEEARSTPNGEGLFWKIEDSGKQPSYLFGTMDYPDARVLTHPPDVMAAFDASKVVATQSADISDAALDSVLPLAVSAIGVAGLPGKARRFIRLRLAELGIPAELADRVEPGFLLALLTFSRCDFDDTSDTRGGGLVPLAVKQGKTVLGLEAPDEVMRAWISIDSELMQRAIMASSRVESHPDDLRETEIRIYLARRPGMLRPFWTSRGQTENDDAVFRELSELDFAERVMKLRDKSLLHVRRGGVFIAVSADFLPGADGLVELYRKSGFAVTRIW